MQRVNEQFVQKFDLRNSRNEKCETSFRKSECTDSLGLTINWCLSHHCSIGDPTAYAYRQTLNR
jgi:hypothetical protein